MLNEISRVRAKLLRIAAFFGCASVLVFLFHDCDCGQLINSKVNSGDASDRGDGSGKSRPKSQSATTWEIASSPAFDLSASRREFFIDPKLGSDANPGTQQQPFQSIERAKQEIRKWNTKDDSVLVVNLLPGQYDLARPIVFESQDSGTASHPIIYQAYQGGIATISGATKLNSSQWSVHDASSKIVKSSVNGTVGNEFFVNGRRAIRARSVLYPDRFQWTQEGFQTDNISWENWPQLANTELVILSSFRVFRCKIAAAQSKTIRMQDRCWELSNSNQRLGVTLKDFMNEPAGKVAWIENNIRLLNQPGEWYLDRGNSTIYYVLRTDESTQNLVGLLPRLPTLIQFKGTATKPVANIILKGLKLTGTTSEFSQTSSGYSPVQAGAFYPENTNLQEPQNYFYLNRAAGMIAMEWAENISLVSNSLLAGGGAGVDLRSGCKNNWIINNLIADFSAGGITLGSYNFNDVNAPSAPAQLVSDNHIADNLIQFVGRHYFDAVGIFVGYARGTVIENNDILDLPYTGISVGWGWTLQTSLLGNHQVIDNRILRTVTLLDDGAGIYTLSSQPGTVLTRNNVFGVRNLFSQVTRHVPMLAGIYLDNGSSFISVTNNSINGVEPNSAAGKTLSIFEQNAVPPFAKNNRVIDNLFSQSDRSPSAHFRPDSFDSQALANLSDYPLIPALGTEAYYDNSTPLATSTPPPSPLPQRTPAAIQLLVNGGSSYNGAANKTLEFKWLGTGNIVRIDPQQTVTPLAGLTCGAPLLQAAPWTAYTGGTSGSYLSSYGANWQGCGQAVCFYAYDSYNRQTKSCVTLSFP